MNLKKNKNFCSKKFRGIVFNRFYIICKKDVFLFIVEMNFLESFYLLLNKHFKIYYERSTLTGLNFFTQVMKIVLSFYDLEHF